MSDFDEEAERRRLREKYEKDEARREETQQMSELLLKGATMTNQHCGECGSPIFRYDGQEFCPSCQRVAGAAGEQAGADAEAETGADAAAAPRSGTETPQPGEQPSGGGDESGSEAGSIEVDVAAGDAEPATGASERSESASPATGQASPSRSVERPVEGADADVGSARAALLRALQRHAELAEATEDPRRAKDHLAAAREASEALDALDR